ncbi:MAG: Aldehyde Dehydrogenase [Clostridia bacterium]|jgi:propionaldehyde dehydrogenase|nr:Aldehyde Dehydrogenase [Clostridia bacterium]
MDIQTQDVERIVQQVLKNILPEAEQLIAENPTEPVIHTYQPGITAVPNVVHTAHLDKENYGVFETIEAAIEAAHTAQKIYVKKFQLKDRERLIQTIRQAAKEEVNTLAQMTKDETKLGRYEDKIQKNLLVIEKTPGTECLKTKAISGDDGLTIIEHAPFGLIGAITPVTNPTETIINNVISMIAGGNTVVFNVHPSAKKCCAYCVQLINKAIEEAGGPKNLVTMVKEPSMDTVKKLCESDKVKLLVGTGGMQMVRSLLKSGKKVIGAGAGNPPVIVDETADIKRAAEQLFLGASFDNNILCLAEKEVFVLERAASDLMYHMINKGAFLLNNEQLNKVMELVLTYEETPQGKDYHVNKKWVGQDAGKMLEAVGINGRLDCRLLICEVAHTHPFVMLEQLMPILPLVKCQSLEEAIAYALEAEQGNRHTASMFSRNIDHLTKFAREIETTIFVKNAATLAGVGFEGEGHSTMTIAGPTGEGITSAVSFTRQRRCTLADGSFRII